MSIRKRAKPLRAGEKALDAAHEKMMSHARACSVCYNATKIEGFCGRGYGLWKRYDNLRKAYEGRHGN